MRRRQEMEAATAGGVLDLGEVSKNADDQRTETAPVKRLSSQEERELTKKMNALERKMGKLDDKTAKLNEKMAQAAEKMSSGEGDSGELAKIDADLKAVAAEREELEMEWLELGEKLEG